MEDNKGYYRGKNAIVTGAASGIGLALCEELLLQGAGKVVMSDINEEGLRREETRLNGLYPGRVRGIGCDVTQEQKVQTMIDQAVAFMDGQLDLLINNAGAGLQGVFVVTPGSNHPMESMYLKEQSNEMWERAFALNFYGALYGSRAAIRVMSPQGGGQVVNIISGIAWSPMAYQSMYASTKAALHLLTLTLRYEYWDEGIKFNAATPGTTATAIWDAIPGGAPESAQTPQESARTILRGAAENQRTIFGDKGDEEGAKDCFHPDAAEGKDAYFLNVARIRHTGKLVI